MEGEGVGIAMLGSVVGFVEGCRDGTMVSDIEGIPLGVVEGFIVG
jgi:hypothetical protein